jgi:hypothetical protein
MNSFQILLKSNTFNEIHNEFGDKVGFFDYTICNNASMLPVSFKYSAGICYYISQIKGFAWPVAYLNRIEVSEKRRGYGTRGLELFYSKVQDQNCSLCMLRVGWENPQDEEYNRIWYERRGWELLNDAPPWKEPLYLMYKWI